MARETLDAGSDPGGEATGPRQPGEVIAGRYRISRQIAEGGHGVVYQADDLLVGEPVALKALRPASAGDPRAAERLRQELALARRVTHPAVCRIFDVADDGGPLLTMELLSGTTLAERIRAAGRLPPDQVLAIAEQLAAGLDAAHAVGVVHRDFKSQNVMIETGGRAVITDFGLALQAAPPSSATATADAGLVGTPAYMAPEQVEGRPGTRAVDVYAFGVVLFEMVTGGLPFDGPTPMAVATARLRAEPPSPRGRVRELPRHWDRAIRRCMALDPADRFSTATEVVAALRAPARSRRSIPWLAAAAVAATVAAVVAWIASDRAPSEAPVEASVAVVEIAGDSWQAAAVSELLAAELGGPVVPVDEAGGDYRVVGTLSKDVLAVSLVDSTGQLAAWARESTTGEPLPAVARRTADRLRETVSDLASAPARIALPADAEAAKAYALALSARRRHQPLIERALLARAHQLAPDDPLIEAARAELALASGQLDAGRQAYRRAFELATSLPAGQRDAIELRYRTWASDTARALELARAAHEERPGDVWRSAALIEALAAGGQPAQALDTARAIGASRGDHPRLAIAEANVAGAIYDHERQRAAAARAATLAADRRAPLAEAEARAIESTASLALGDHARALAAAEQAETIHRRRGDVMGRIGALSSRWGILFALGRLREARALAARAVDLAITPGFELLLPWLLQAVAATDAELADVDAAARRCALAVTLDRSAETAALLRGYCDHILGAGLRLRGDTATAIEILDRAVATLETAHDATLLPHTRIERALARLDRADLAGAGADLDWVEDRAAATATAALALARCDLALAGRDAAAALGHARDAEQTLRTQNLPLAASQVATLEAALAAGDRAAATTAADELVRDLPAIEAPPLRLRAIAALARAGRRVDVAGAIDEAVRLDLPGHQLRLRAAAGDDPEALAREATGRGLLALADYLRWASGSRP